MKSNINAIVVPNDTHRIACDTPFYVRENNTWKCVTILNKSASMIAGFRPTPKFDLEVSECEEPKTGYRVVPKYRLPENDVEEMETLTSQKGLNIFEIYKIFDFIKIITRMYGTISIVIDDEWEYAIPFDYNREQYLSQSRYRMMICCEWNGGTYAFDEYGKRYILNYHIDNFDLNIDEDFKLINVSAITPIQYSIFPEPCKNFKADRKKTKELLKNIKEAIPGSKPFMLCVDEASDSTINSYAYALR